MNKLYVNQNIFEDGPKILFDNTVLIANSGFIKFKVTDYSDLANEQIPIYLTMTVISRGNQKVVLNMNKKQIDNIISDLKKIRNLVDYEIDSE